MGTVTHIYDQHLIDPRPKYVVGVDLGQSHDPTAIAVIEIETRFHPRENSDHVDVDHVYNLRHLERLPLRTSYVQQVELVAERMARPPLAPAWNPWAQAEVGAELLVDFTGVGRAVFDIFHERGVRAKGVTITAGTDVTREATGWRVAKQVLVSTLQSQMHSGRLRIAATMPDAPAFVRELTDFRVTYTSAGNAVFNARQGAHDDMVLAVAIALWRAVERAGKGARSGFVKLLGC